MEIDYDKMDKVENKVHEMLEEYGAPEEIDDHIKEFLFDSMYIDQIIGAAVNVGVIKD